MSAPSFTYYSSVRRGLAAAITTPDDASVPGHVSLKAAAVTEGVEKLVAGSP